MTQNPRFGCESAPYQQSRVTLVEADGATRASQLPGLGSKQGVTMRLTVKSTETLKLPVGKTDHVFWDADVVEFGLRIRAGGSRNWIYQYCSSCSVAPGERHGLRRAEHHPALPLPNAPGDAGMKKAARLTRAAPSSRVVKLSAYFFRHELVATLRHAGL
jgi:hypothetical protein